MDTDPIHPDLQGRVIPGWTPNCLTNCDGRPRNLHCHGQAVAGIIAASHNNIGVRGVAPGVTIVPFRIFKGNYDSQCGHCNPFSDKNIAKAINKAWDDFHCDVLNNSWGRKRTSTPSNVVKDAINNAVKFGRNGLGSVVVFAAGNEGTGNNSTVGYYGNLPNVIAVSALNKFATISCYSSRGPEVNVAAFGGGTLFPSGCITSADIRTTDRTGNKGYTSGNYTNTFNGTSAACPQVSGIAALLLSVNPNLTAEQVKCRIEESARDIDAFGFDNNTGFGVANAYYTIALTNMVIENENVTGQDDFVSSNNTIGQNTVFANGSEVNIIAGNRIVATAGSSAKLGSFFHARIQSTDPCGSVGGPFRTSNNNTSLKNRIGNLKINKKVQQNNYTLYLHPNPNFGHFYIQLPVSEQEPAKITIINLLGQKVLEMNNVTATELEINLTNQPKGIYLLKVLRNNTMFIKKILLQ